MTPEKHHLPSPPLPGWPWSTGPAQPFSLTGIRARCAVAGACWQQQRVSLSGCSHPQLSQVAASFDDAKGCNLNTANCRASARRETAKQEEWPSLYRLWEIDYSQLEKKNHRATERWLETLEKNPIQQNISILRVPARKQDTDTMQ